MKTVIINNTVLRNNGDVAIVLALHDALIDLGYDVLVATSYRDFVRTHYPKLRTCADVLGYSLSFARRSRLLGDLSALAMLLFSPKYRRAAAIIGAPGGYLNSFYGFAWKLRIYRWAHVLGKYTCVYSQSVGPLNPSDATRLRSASRYLNKLVVRDSVSLETARGIGLDEKRLVLTPDAIFLRRFCPSAASPQSKVAAVSVREWKHEGRSRDDYSRMIVACVKLMLESGFDVEFISTCQGIPGYTDDSAFASEIVAKDFSEERRSGRVKVDREFHSLDALEKKIATYNFVVGTRLHMCLLSLMKGVPALNISYEIKGKESYRYLGFESYSLDYNASASEAVAALRMFLREKDSLRTLLPEVVSRLHRRARDQLSAVVGEFAA